LSPTRVDLARGFFRGVGNLRGGSKGGTSSDSSSPRFLKRFHWPFRQNHLLVRAFINGNHALLGVDSGAR